MARNSGLQEIVQLLLYLRDSEASDDSWSVIVEVLVVRGYCVTVCYEDIRSLLHSVGKVVYVESYAFVD